MKMMGQKIVKYDMPYARLSFGKISGILPNVTLYTNKLDRTISGEQGIDSIFGEKSDRIEKNGSGLQIIMFEFCDGSRNRNCHPGKFCIF